MTPPIYSTASKAIFQYEPSVRLALIDLCERLCTDADEVWRRRSNADDTTTVADGQTRALLEFLTDSMAKETAAKRRLFHSVSVPMRLFQLTKYLRDCCNKHRYNSLSQAEQLADALLFDELLAALARLLPDESLPVAAARRDLARVTELLLQQTADAKGLSLGPQEGAHTSTHPPEQQAVDGDADCVQGGTTADPIGDALQTHSGLLRGLKDGQAKVLSALSDIQSQLGADTASGTDAAWDEPTEDLAAELRRLRDENAPLAADDDALAYDDDYDEESDLDQGSDPLTSEEARDALVALRWQIWNDLHSGPGLDGLLRRRLLDTFVRHRINSHEKLRMHISKSDLARLDQRQLDYLPAVFAIVDRIHDPTA